MLRVLAWCVLPLVAGCVSRPPTVPMPFEFFPAPSGEPRDLVVMLHGRGGSPADFVENGVVAAAQAADPACDVIAVDAHLGYYRARTIVDRLHADVIGPRRARYHRVVLVGVSMGGLGALAYTVEHPDDVAGVVLMAPYLGDDIVDEVAAAGGLADWEPPELGGEGDDGRRRFVEVWSLLRRCALGRDPMPLFVAHGEDDRLRSGGRLVGSLLPAERYLVRPGGHKWSVWGPLFAELLPVALAPTG